MDADLTLVPLHEAHHEPAFGGKAASLAAALREGLPVPPGAALGSAFVDRAAAGDAAAVEALLESEHVPDARLAVRSSAVGEDSAGASFAGQHATKLNVRRPKLLDAVRMVWHSARTDSALAYRAKKGLDPSPRMGVVVQALIEPVAAGVLFTRNPVTGVEERLIEAAWGLGEAVVNGAVVPDRIRLDPGGRVVDVTVGEKDIKVWYDDEDGTVEVPVDASLQAQMCLEPVHFEALHDLAARCQRLWGRDLDLEWALDAGGRIFLLQCRPITTGRA
ncbi:MAG TPA: PEP/pyruvate-binding domain-containing protein [Vicinamibacterales bacterium]|nr:PEP/pyruvate-binding domain-containing protein [Vicinamibacterales bacterium]